MKTGFWLRGGKGEATALQKISFFSFLVLRAFAEKGETAGKGVYANAAIRCTLHQSVQFLADGLQLGADVLQFLNHLDVAVNGLALVSASLTGKRIDHIAG